MARMSFWENACLPQLNLVCHRFLCSEFWSASLPLLTFFCPDGESRAPSSWRFPVQASLLRSLLCSCQVEVVCGLSMQSLLTAHGGRDPSFPWWECGFQLPIFFLMRLRKCLFIHNPGHPAGDTPSVGKFKKYILFYAQAGKSLDHQKWKCAFL